MPSRHNRTRPPRQRSGPPKRLHNARRKRTPRRCARPRKKLRRRLEADAEAKRQADEALARRKPSGSRPRQEARPKAEAEQAALRQSSEEAQRKARRKPTACARPKRSVPRPRPSAEGRGRRQKGGGRSGKVRAEAETAEKALRLDQADRERLQLALTSLGFDTRGTDGVFGPRSREMISAWQKARNQPATGFLTAAQQEAAAEGGRARPSQARRAEEGRGGGQGTTCRRCACTSPRR